MVSHHSVFPGHAHAREDPPPSRDASKTLHEFAKIPGDRVVGEFARRPGDDEVAALSPGSGAVFNDDKGMCDSLGG